MTAETMTTADGMGLGGWRVTPLELGWGGLLLLGLAQFVGGAFALAVPVAATLAAALVLGAVLVVEGVLQAVHAFQVKNWKGFLLHALGALLYILAGGAVLLFPLGGALTLTLVVATLLVADGVVRCVLAYRVRPHDHWGWILAAGIASSIVGVLLFLGWPLTGLWAIGVLLGINLLFTGIVNCTLAVTFRRHVASVAGDAGRAEGIQRNA